jgi:hypothetical protein
MSNNVCLKIYHSPYLIGQITFNLFYYLKKRIEYQIDTPKLVCDLVNNLIYTDWIEENEIP